VFDLSLTKLLVLAVIALVVFGPKELPRVAQRAGRTLRELRRLADGAKADLREGLGPEFQDFDFDDLNPRRFVQRHLLDDMTSPVQEVMDEFKHSPTVAQAAAAGSQLTLLDGEDPPFDMEAT
jgi:sec-independent protein translocase protein TatB